MHHYHITEDVEQDLRDIARYTLSKFGPTQLAIYRQALNTRLYMDSHVNNDEKFESREKSPPHLNSTSQASIGYPCQ